MYIHLEDILFYFYNSYNISMIIVCISLYILFDFNFSNVLYFFLIIFFNLRCSGVSFRQKDGKNIV